jgi:hypothetical protein
MKEKINKFLGIPLGVLFGTLVGIALNNIGLWICLGLAIGAAVDYTKKKQSDD